MKVLVTDKIDESAIYLLKNNGVEVDYRPDITPDDLLRVIQDYEALLVRSRTKVTKKVLNCSRKLKVIGRVGSGIDNIDNYRCRQKKIIVINAPGINSQAAAEFTVLLILSLLRKLERALSSMKNGLWLKKELVGSELNKKTVGIVGYGHVGKKVAQLVTAFGAKVLIYSRNYQKATLREIFIKSDIVSIHLSLNNQTKKCITYDLLSIMKSDAIFLNTSRGEIIDREALYKVLKENKIKGAALDVFYHEPLAVDSYWRELDNVILTPHIAGSTKEALRNASLTAAGGIIKVFEDKLRYQKKSYRQQ